MGTKEYLNGGHFGIRCIKLNNSASEMILQDFDNLLKRHCYCSSSLALQ